MGAQKLTQTVLSKVVNAIKVGAYIETAAAFAGISKSTLYDWLRKGANNPGTPYATFAECVAQAMAASEVRDLAIITLAAKKAWQAAAWKLERKHPQKYGRRQVIQLGRGDEQPTDELDLSMLSDEELRTLEFLMGKGKKKRESEEEERITTDA